MDICGNHHAFMPEMCFRPFPKECRSSPFREEIAISISIEENMTHGKGKHQWLKFISNTYSYQLSISEIKNNNNFLSHSSFFGFNNTHPSSSTFHHQHCALHLFPSTALSQLTTTYRLLS